MAIWKILHAAQILADLQLLILLIIMQVKLLTCTKLDLTLRDIDIECMHVISTYHIHLHLVHVFVCEQHTSIIKTFPGNQFSKGLVKSTDSGHHLGVLVLHHI